MKRLDVDDQQLVICAQNGDRQAFSEIVRRFEKMVFSVCVRILCDSDDADECAQEVFVRVYNKISAFRSDSSVSTWIYRIAYNLSLDYARSKKRARAHLQDNASKAIGLVRDFRVNVERSAEINEESVFVRNALLNIDARERAIIVMYDMEGYSYEEISKITGLPMGTVKSRLARGRSKLRELLRGKL